VISFNRKRNIATRSELITKKITVDIGNGPREVEVCYSTAPVEPPKEPVVLSFTDPTQIAQILKMRDSMFAAGIIPSLDTDLAIAEFVKQLTA